MSKRKNESPVWALDLYEKIGGTSAKCQKCDVNLSRPNGINKALVKHLEVIGHEEFKQKYKELVEAQKRSTSTQQSLDRFTKVC